MSDGGTAMTGEHHEAARTDGNAAGDARDRGVRGTRAAAERETGGSGPHAGAVDALPGGPASTATGATTIGKPWPGGAPRLRLRGGTADPVKLLLHRHRELCENAVDPLEIAAGLEAHGITDRAALTRFRHRDVFSLADELFARTPHPSATTGPLGPAAAGGHEPLPCGGAERAPGRGGWSRRGIAAGPHHTGWIPVTLLPGAVAAAVLGGFQHTAGHAHLALGLLGAVALPLTLSAALRHGPLRATGRTVNSAGAWVCWLVGFLLYGEGLLGALVHGGLEGPWPGTLTPLVPLSLAVAPGAWCAHLFSVHARRGLTGSRRLADFAASTRPLLVVGVLLYSCVLAGLCLLAPLALRGPVEPAPTVALGTLLLLARLLALHGFPEAAATGLACAAAAEGLACACLLAARLPGCAALAVPVTDALRLAGPAAVPVLACGAAAAGLLAYAAVTLARASAHT
jgi:hypothetical protein